MRKKINTPEALPGELVAWQGAPIWLLRRYNLGSPLRFLISCIECSKLNIIYEDENHKPALRYMNVSGVSSLCGAWFIISLIWEYQHALNDQYSLTEITSSFLMLRLGIGNSSITDIWMQKGMSSVWNTLNQLLKYASIIILRLQLLLLPFMLSTLLEEKTKHEILWWCYTDITELIIFLQMICKINHLGMVKQEKDIHWYKYIFEIFKILHWNSISPPS